MVVARQEVFAHTDALVEIWDMGAASPARTLIAKNGRYGVSLTPTSDVAGTDSIEIGPITITRDKVGGVGNDKATAIDATQAAGVAVDGTWEFDTITGVTTSTAQSTPIYITAGGVLTNSSSGNTKIGETNYPASYVKATGIAPIKIGV